MAQKTIALDLEAYTLLVRNRRAGQSFSDLIKERFGRWRTARQFRAALAHVRVSEETIAALDAIVAARRLDRPRRRTV